MKKKVFIQLNVDAIIVAVLPLLIAMTGIAAIIRMILRNYYLLEIIIVLLGTIYLFYLFYAVISYRIILDKEFIKGTKSKRGVSRVQRNTVIVNYKNIVNMYLISSNKNSENKPITSGWLSETLEIRYWYFLILEEKNSKKKTRIWLAHFSMKQKKKIIDELKLRIKNSGNHTEFKDTKDVLEEIGTRRTR